MASARLFARCAVAIPQPPDILFVETDVYAWRALDELAVALSWTGAREESVEIMRQLLAGDALPPDHRARVEKNLALVLDLMKS